MELGGALDAGREPFLLRERVEPVAVDAGDDRAGGDRASAASTPPRPRPTSWPFIASVNAT